MSFPPHVLRDWVQRQGVARYSSGLAEGLSEEEVNGAVTQLWAHLSTLSDLEAVLELTALLGPRAMAEALGRVLQQRARSARLYSRYLPPRPGGVRPAILLPAPSQAAAARPTSLVATPSTVHPSACSSLAGPPPPAPAGRCVTFAGPPPATLASGAILGSGRPHPRLFGTRGPVSYTHLRAHET